MNVRTVCPYCGVGCGLVLRVEEGRVVGGTPEQDHPVSRGTLCPKGATAHEFIHHPDRLTTPLIRKDGRLTPASWTEAYATIATAFSQIRRDHGASSLSFISSARATLEENWLAQKYARAVLGTNQLDQCFRICHSATVTGLLTSLGSGAMSNPIEDLADPGPRVALIVGSNTAHSHPIVWTVWLHRALQNGMKLIVIDPRTTEVAKRATLHLSPYPGSEVALFNAMAKHIVSKNLVNDAFLSARCEGRDALETFLAQLSIEDAAETCGIAPQAIRDAAELYARHSPATILYGLGVTEHHTGVDNVRSLANLALLTGNFGKPGTGVNALRGQNDVQGATDVCRPESLPGYQEWTPDNIARFESAWNVKLPIPDAGGWLWCSRMWESALQGELRGMHIMGSDPALTEGDLAKVHRGLDALEFLVVQDIFPTETTAFADVVLPAASFAEKDGTFVNTDRRVQRIRKAVEPPGESRADWRILCELSATLGYDMGVNSPESAFDEMCRLVPIFGGLSYARLERPGGIHWPCPTPDHPGTPRLHERTFPRGRARLAVCDHRPPAETPDAAYPFLLTTGRTFFQYNCGTNSRRTRMERIEPKCILQMSEKDAARAGIRDGARVRVTTRRGTVVVNARIGDIREGVIWMPFHYAETPANRLTNDVVDPECGITELKACAARVEPA